MSWSVGKCNQSVDQIWESLGRNKGLGLLLLPSHTPHGSLEWMEVSSTPPPHMPTSRPNSEQKVGWAGSHKSGKGEKKDNAAGEMGEVWGGLHDHPTWVLFLKHSYYAQTGDPWVLQIGTFNHLIPPDQSGNSTRTVTLSPWCSTQLTEFPALSKGLSII